MPTISQALALYRIHAIACYLGAYRIEVAFNDGKTGIADLSEALTGPVFELLKHPQAFIQFSVDAELETLVWQNEAQPA